MRMKAIKTGAALGLALAFALAGTASAQQVTISSGHVDALAFSYDDTTNRLDIDVEVHSTGQIHEPGDVVFDVHDGHQVTMANPIACRADAGVNWVLPRTEQVGKIWAGWTTEGLNLADFGGSVEAELVSASMPTGGNVSVYDAATNQTRFHTDPSCNAPSTNITEPHHHPTWVFTEPGTYRLTFQATGTHATDGAVSSDPITYTFEVGGA